MKMETILTGVRSNEEPTLANYLGAFQPMVAMQKAYADRYNINMFVPDLHSFTTPINHASLYKNTLHNLKYFIAAGLDATNENTYIYRQSYIPAHSELTWILDCFTTVGEMSRMIQFKEKSANHHESVSVGLFNYPVLMAADILLYNAKYVPVGEDQFQHLEITRDIAERFNKKFGDVFTVPVPTDIQMNFINRNKGLRIRSLTDPTKKMSKSSMDSKSMILLNDSPSLATKKIMSATTDSLQSIDFDWVSRPGVTNLLQILVMLSGEDHESVVERWRGNERYGDLKKEVADVVSSFLEKLQSSVADISNDQIELILNNSESKMRQIAEKTLLKAQVAVGLRPVR